MGLADPLLEILEQLGLVGHIFLAPELVVVDCDVVLLLLGDFLDVLEKF